MSTRQEDDEGAVSPVDADAEGLAGDFALAVPRCDQWRTQWNLAAVGSSRLLQPARLAWPGALPFVEVDGDALDQHHGHPRPSQGPT